MNPSPICRLANRQFLFRTLFTSRPALRSSKPPLQNVRIIRNVSERRRVDDFDNEDFTQPFRKLYRNPLDHINNHRRELAERHYRMRRIRIAAFGAIVCMAAQIGIVLMFPQEDSSSSTKPADEAATSTSTLSSLVPRDRADAPPEANREFQGKPVKVLGGGARIVAKDESSGEEVELVSTGTSTVPHFPRTILLPTGDDGRKEEYTLLGLGIRTVSFLGVQVYVAGLYVATASLSGLQADLVKTVNPIASALIPGEKEQLRAGLLDGERSYEIWDQLLKEKGSDVKSAWRIVPVRNTDFAHLRDGWVRGITSKTQAASASKAREQFSDDAFGAAMREFKAVFGGKGRAPKGSVLLVTRGADGTLGVLFQEKEGKGEALDFGHIADERIARLIWLGYLGGKNVSSEAARRGIVDGIMELVERPIGSVETKVL